MNSLYTVEGVIGAVGGAVFAQTEKYLQAGSLKIFRWLYIAAVFIGPYFTVSAVWVIADIFNALMAIPNLIALLSLSGVVVAETQSYLKRMNLTRVK